MQAGAQLIDSNILIRWVKPDDRDYDLVNSVIDGLLRQGITLCYTSQNLGEFWNACTRPVDKNGYGLSTADADFRAKLIEDRLNLLDDSAAVHKEWRRIIVRYSVSGVQVHDARLVAAMRVHGVKQILTFNDRDFARYSDIQALNPGTLLQENP